MELLLTPLKRTTSAMTKAVALAILMIGICLELCIGVVYAAPAPFPDIPVPSKVEIPDFADQNEKSFYLQTQEFLWSSKAYPVGATPEQLNYRPFDLMDVVVLPDGKEKWKAVFTIGYKASKNADVEQYEVAYRSIGDSRELFDGVLYIKKVQTPELSDFVITLMTIAMMMTAIIRRPSMGRSVSSILPVKTCSIPVFPSPFQQRDPSVT